MLTDKIERHLWTCFKKFFCYIKIIKHHLLIILQLVLLSVQHISKKFVVSTNGNVNLCWVDN